MHVASRLLRNIAIILFSLMVFSCREQPAPAPIPPKPSAKPAKTVKAPPKPVFQSDSYIKHLTLAQLNLAYGADVSSVSEDLDILQAYAEQKIPAPTKQTVIVLVYKRDKMGAKQSLIAPISIAAQNIGFPDLLDIMIQLERAPYILHDIYLAELPVLAQDNAMVLADSPIETIRQSLQQEQQRLLSQAERTPIMTDIRMQLSLISFFMDHGFRDAAYLAVDNAKKKLALASESKASDALTIQNMSHELEAIESKLHKLLPFTLSMNAQ